MSVPSQPGILRHESSPRAARAAKASWRDPRLAVGVALVCISVLVGVRVMARADDTVAVLAAQAPLAAGQRLTADDLVAVQLRFTTTADADRYVGADTDLDEGAVLVRAVGAGELVPRAALSTQDQDALVELPLALDPGRVPAAVRVGSTVDVWASSPSGGKGAAEPAEQLLSAVPVLSASQPVGGGAGGLRQVVVGVPSTAESELARIVARLTEASLLLVRRPG